MVELASFLRDLDKAVLHGTAESSARALWHATDLLITGSYSEEEIWTFGEVIGRLADEIEVAVRVELAQRMARLENAPVNLIRKLAFDDSIEVAGPVLRESEWLDDDTLVEAAETKDQPHLLAISQRKSVEQKVTDVLVTRGNQEVVNSIAANDGARFSNFGFMHMVKRAEGDSILAEQLGLRKDIPRHLFQQLIAKASEDVRKRLEGERPDMVEEIRHSVTDVAGALQSMLGPMSRSYYVAKRIVTAQHRLGNLNENSISGYAQAHKFDEATIGLSLLCSLPADVIERVLIDRSRHVLLIVAKALEFSWDTTMAVLFLGAKDHRITAKELSELKSEFDRLSVEISQIVLEFYKARKNGELGDSVPSLEPQSKLH